MTKISSGSPERAPKKILFLSSEVTPFAKTGGLADVSASLPEALTGLGLDVYVVMPLYRQVRESGAVLKPLKRRLEIPFQHRILQTRVFFSDIPSGPRVYFIERDEFYDRSGLYGTPGGDYFDNDSRFIFFSLASLQLSRQIGFRPDVIHCNDWPTGLVPAYVRSSETQDPFFRKTGLLLTIHNLAYQGLFPPETMEVADLPAEFFSMDGLEFHGRMNFLKGGIVFSHRINTVSPRYAEEIQTSDFGQGLEGVLSAKSGILSGILNGIDDSVWNPESDPYIAANYSPADPQGKKACKIELMKLFALDGTESRPIIGMVTRLAGQKGLDILAEAVDRLCAMDLSLVIQGRGEARYEKLFTEIGRTHRGRVGVHTAFDEAVAHKIEAGSDMFLMPSRYEPCGLNQMYSLKYGTIPIVRATGGLDDTVQAFDPRTKEGNGFKFRAYTPRALTAAVGRALRVYRSPSLWASLMQNAFSADFSWSEAALRYRVLYAQTLSAVRLTESVSKRSGK